MHNELSEQNGSIELPAPSPWPLVFGLALALVMAGVLVSAKLSVAGGVLALIAAAAWWLEVLPGEKHERVPIRPAGEGITPAGVEVEILRFEAGRFIRHSGHMRPFTAAARGALVGGVAMAAVAMLFGLISQGSIWYPINLLAAGAVSDLAGASVVQLRQFSGAGLGAGIVIHGLTSFLIGVLYSVMLPMFPRRAFWWAGLTAPILWSALIAGLLELINPAMNARIDWLWFVGSQLAWGLTGGFVIAKTERIDSLVSLPLAVRAGIEAQTTET